MKKRALKNGISEKDIAAFLICKSSKKEGPS